MRYFDLRGLLPQAEQPSTEALATFERIAGVGEAARTEPRLPEEPGPPEMEVRANRRGCPDLAGQLRAASKGDVDTVICSLLDGDATLRLNAAVAARYPEELMAGVEYLERIVMPKRSWVVMDETAPANWLAPVRGAAKLGRRRVVALRNDYPESDPSLLLFTLLKRRLRPGRLPTEVGVVLVDAPAAVALGMLARSGEAPRVTWVAVHHPEWGATRYAEVDVGTALGRVLSQMGVKEDHVVRAGDLLRDRKVLPEMVIGEGELTFHVAYPERPVNPDPCVRCGWCIEGCPVRIDPAGILEAAQRGDLRLGRHYGMDSCIECGICSYVCPSHLPLLPGIRRLRGEVA